jgi:hypothetical protein
MARHQDYGARGPLEQAAGDTTQHHARHGSMRAIADDEHIGACPSGKFQDCAGRVAGGRRDERTAASMPS